MFTVAIRGLGEASQELQQMITKLNRQIQHTEDIISSVRRISAYYEVIHYLKIHLENMNVEKKQMMDMMAAMNQIQRIYLQCEQNITDYGDEVRKASYYRSMNVVSLSGVRSQILDYHIR
jgi:septal ring factor EnvC (AmiA/AmiB activator)